MTKKSKSTDQEPRRPLPAWFSEAGLGIFIHWGPFAIPAYAPVPEPGVSFPDLLRVDPRHMGERMPYSEWYRNAMTIEGSPTAMHHRRVWNDAPYEDFQAMFESGLDNWDPGAWADLFRQSGAKYVVMVTKHHDGYCLWPTEQRHPNRPGWFSKRDMVGELAVAVRECGMRFGVYYSTGLDWSFNHFPIREIVDAVGCTPRSDEYLRYMSGQLEELIQRYEPSVLWADIGTPPGFEVTDFKERLLARIPDAVINDRWDHPVPGTGSKLGRMIWNNLFALVIPRSKPKPFYPGRHAAADFRTAEYSVPDGPTSYAWEATRGMGSGFGFNAEETDAHRIDPDELVQMYRDVRSAGGNMLLNVGPLADGTISEAEALRLRRLGESISGT